MATDNTLRTETAPRSMKNFKVLWVGSLINALGSGMTAFGVAAVAFRLTGSATAVSAVLASALVPPILLGPVTGVAADRFDRRVLMALGDGGGITGIAIVWFALSQAIPSIVLVCLGMLVTGMFVAIAEPAFKASITDLVEPDDYARSSALMQLVAAGRLLLAPFAAGLVLEIATIHTILAIDAATVVVTVACTLFVQRSIGTTARSNSDSDVLADLREGARVLASVRGVTVLVTVFVLATFAAGLAQVLFKPMMLPRISVTQQGILESVSASGLIAGSIVVGAITARRGSYQTLVIGMFLSAVFLAALPFGSPWWVGTMGFLFFAALALINTGADVLVRSSLPNEAQGRAWGLIGLVSQLGFPVAYVIGGPLADLVFEPLLVSDGPLASTLGSIVGVGPGRGISLIFALAGVLMAISAVAVKRAPSVASLEPDLESRIELEAIPC